MRLRIPNPALDSPARLSSSGHRPIILIISSAHHFGNNTNNFKLGIHHIPASFTYGYVGASSRVYLLRIPQVKTVQIKSLLFATVLQKHRYRYSLPAPIYLLNSCTVCKKSRSVLLLHAWVLQESWQYSPSLFVSSGMPAQGSFRTWLRGLSKILKR